MSQTTCPNCIVPPSWVVTFAPPVAKVQPLGNGKAAYLVTVHMESGTYRKAFHSRLDAARWADRWRAQGALAIVEPLG